MLSHVCRSNILTNAKFCSCSLLFVTIYLTLWRLKAKCDMVSKLQWYMPTDVFFMNLPVMSDWHGQWCFIVNSSTELSISVLSVNTQIYFWTQSIEFNDEFILVPIIPDICHGHHGRYPCEIILSEWNSLLHI